MSCILDHRGYKRLFYCSMPKNTLSFHHPFFRRDSPDLCKDMNMSPCSSGSGASATEGKKKAKAAPVAEAEDQPLASPPVKVKVESSPAAAPSTQSILAQAQKPAAVLSVPQQQAQSIFAPAPQPPAVLNVQSQPAQAAAPTGSPQAVCALLDQLRTHVAAEAASKDLLLRQAMAMEQQRSALRNNSLMSQGNSSNNNNNTNNPTRFLEGLLSLLVGIQQPVSNPNPQMAALVASAMPANAVAPVIPAAPPRQTPPAASLLQLLTPAQQLLLLNQLTGSSQGLDPQR